MNELEVINFWNQNQIFEKSIENNKSGETFLFLDGPPFASGTPHWGHVFISQVKDSVLRFQTQKGRCVPRRWGWDCHGVPIESMVEKQLGITDKRQIEEEVGIEEFNRVCKENIFKYDSEWRSTIERIGRWVDMDDQYRTLDNDFSESVWWGLKQLWDRGLIYKGYRMSLYSPSLGIPLSHTDVAMEVKYQNETVVSPFVMFELQPKSQEAILEELNKGLDQHLEIQKNLLPKVRSTIENEDLTKKNDLETLKSNINKLHDIKKLINYRKRVYLVAWTTTPWTLPSNSGLVVGKDIEYRLSYLPDQDIIIVIAEKLADNIFQESGHASETIATITGEELLGFEYSPLFAPSLGKEGGGDITKLYKVWVADFATDEEGSGIVHLAPYGPDDFELIKNNNIPFLTTLNEHGEFASYLDSSMDFIKGKKGEASNSLIIESLTKGGNLLYAPKHKHKVPYFDRDGKKVYYSPQEGWFIKETKIKERGVELNHGIDWYPDNIKYGRFGKGLETAPDWSISRNRYWGNPLPIWINKKKEKVEFIGSIEEIVKKAANPFYQILNTRDLQPDLYSKTKTIIFGDSQNNLPLGINAAQHKSKPLSELRNSEQINLSVFSKFAQEILDEILELFNSYDIVQLLLSNEEQKMFTTWFYGLHKDSKKTSKNFYFYKKIKVDETDFEIVEGLIPFDVHRPFIDDIYLQDEGGSLYKRIPEVLDCWVESGSMPWASVHYPFENRELFEKGSPADWIIEAQDQTRGWFRVLHTLSSGIFDRASFKRASVSGMLLAKDGKKMSKSKKNFTPPDELIDKFGADAVRLYLLKSGLLNAESLSFNEKDLLDVFKNSTLLISNSLSYVNLVTSENTPLDTTRAFNHPLNKWLQIYTEEVCKKIVVALDSYDLITAAREVEPYLNNLSTWYIRRSKDILEEYGGEVSRCLLSSLKLFATSIASFQPFNSEKIWSVVKEGGDVQSVHLTRIKTIKTKQTKKELTLLEDMAQLREIVSEIHKMRKEISVRVRQPLRAKIESSFSEYMNQLVLAECNLIPSKDFTNPKLFKRAGITVEISDTVDRELAIMGYARDFERSVQQYRKKSGFKQGEHIKLEGYVEDSQDKELLKQVLTGVQWNKINTEFLVNEKKREVTGEDEFYIEIPSLTKIQIWH